MACYLRDHAVKINKTLLCTWSKLKTAESFPDQISICNVFSYLDVLDIFDISEFDFFFLINVQNFEKKKRRFS